MKQDLHNLNADANAYELYLWKLRQKYASSDEFERSYITSFDMWRRLHGTHRCVN